LLALGGANHFVDVTRIRVKGRIYAVNVRQQGISNRILEKITVLRSFMLCWGHKIFIPPQQVMRWVVDVACMRKRADSHRFCVEKLEEKRQF
jgi:hypothetical protein